MFDQGVCLWSPNHVYIINCGIMCVFFKDRHISRVMEDDSFPFLIAMVPVAWLPWGTGRVQTEIFPNEY